MMRDDELTTMRRPAWRNWMARFTYMPNGVAWRRADAEARRIVRHAISEYFHTRRPPSRVTVLRRTRGPQCARGGAAAAGCWCAEMMRVCARRASARARALM